MRILCWSVGWFTPDTAKQTARTEDRFEPHFERASAITCSNVSLAAVSVEVHNDNSMTTKTMLSSFYYHRHKLSKKAQLEQSKSIIIALIWVEKVPSKDEKSSQDNM